MKRACEPKKGPWAGFGAEGTFNQFTNRDNVNILGPRFLLVCSITVLTNGVYSCIFGCALQQPTFPLPLTCSPIFRYILRSLLNSQLHLRMCTVIYSIVYLHLPSRMCNTVSGWLPVASSDVHCFSPSWLAPLPYRHKSSRLVHVSIGWDPSDMGDGR